MQRCKKNREDPSRVTRFRLVPFLLCAVEDGTYSLTWSSSRGRGATYREWSMAQRVQLTSQWVLSLSLLKQDRELKTRGQLRACRKGVFLVISAINLSPHSKTVRWAKPNKQTQKGDHQGKAKEKKTQGNNWGRRQQKQGRREWSCRTYMYILSEVLWELAAAP